VSGGRCELDITLQCSKETLTRLHGPDLSETERARDCCVSANQDNLNAPQGIAAVPLCRRDSCNSEPDVCSLGRLLALRYHGNIDIAY